MNILLLHSLGSSLMLILGYSAPTPSSPPRVATPTAPSRPAVRLPRRPDMSAGCTATVMMGARRPT